MTRVVPAVVAQVRSVFCLGFLLFVVAPPVLAKGEGVGVYLEGLVSEVRSDGQRTTFSLVGSLRLIQYRGQEKSVIRVQGAAPILVVTRQGDFCFIMVEGWRPGPCRPGQLFQALQTAAAQHRIVTLELGQPTLRFGDGEHGVEVEASEILRVDEPRPEASPSPSPR